MRWIFTIIFLSGFLFSCEDDNPGFALRIPGNPDTEFNKKILSSFFVTSITFDSKGNAWIGTFKQGLIKYSSSGIVFYNFTNSTLPEDLVIWDIEVDSRDNVWIGCDGILKFDGSDFHMYNSSNSEIPEDFVYSIDIDSRDNIWFTSCRFRMGGIVKYDGNTWHVYTPENSDLPVNLVQSISIDKDDNVWLALGEIVNKTSLVKISGNSWTLFNDSDLGFSPYYFGNICINSRNEICGAIDYSLSSTMVQDGPQVFVFDGSRCEQLSFDNMTRTKSLSVDWENNIWCVLYDGYAVYNGEKWFVDQTNFRDNGVFTIEPSPDKKIWIGTGDGIYINGAD